MANDTHDENKLIAERRAKLEALREQGKHVKSYLQGLAELVKSDLEDLGESLGPKLDELHQSAAPDLDELRKLAQPELEGLFELVKPALDDLTGLMDATLDSSLDSTLDSTMDVTLDSTTGSTSEAEGDSACAGAGAGTGKGAARAKPLSLGELSESAGLGKSLPGHFRFASKMGDLQRRHADDSREALAEDNKTVRVRGRLIRDRGAFLLLQDDSGEMQLYVNRKQLSQETLAAIKGWDLGDIIAARGPLRRSGKGDLYIDLRAVFLLTKALRPLPDKHHGLADTELRYRQRYVDLIANAGVREVFRKRARIVDAVRLFMQDKQFMEVETPMLHPIPGGAVARPFVTHHNALDLDMYLRVAPELYLKRLIVGGFERVFEVNRSFRNEGLSTQHNPEFTMLELYWAYADYEDGMRLTESLLRWVCERVLGGTTLSHQGEDYDLAQPFERMTMLESIVVYNSDISPAQLRDDASARQLATHLGIAVQPGWGLGKLQLEIFEKTVEHKLLQPTFIVAYPTEVSPLARRNDDNPFITDRFELFIGGRELANGFSELNDPEDQARRFKQQAADNASGDDEAMRYDADYITALEYGMPPTVGVGIGIDRLVMFLTDSPSIRDVLLFPAMRPERK